MRKLTIHAAGAAFGLAALAAGAQPAGGDAEADASTGSGNAGSSGTQMTARVAANLEESGEVDAANIEVKPVSDIAVELDGMVPTNGQKQEASVVAIQSENVQFVRNELEVDTG